VTSLPTFTVRVGCKVPLAETVSDSVPFFSASVTYTGLALAFWSACHQQSRPRHGHGHGADPHRGALPPFAGQAVAQQVLHFLAAGSRFVLFHVR
jgi:hypothetical protein